MNSWSRCAALAVAAALGVAASAQASTATFIFSDETSFDPNTRATGVLVLEDYVPFGGTFVSWKYFKGSTVLYEVNSSDLVAFSSDLNATFTGSNEQGNVVTIQSATSLFETGLVDPLGGVALLWNLTLNPVCPEVGIPCGGGDGPQVDNGPPFTYTWRLASLATGGVPEPATWALMIGGFGAVGVQLRTRRRRIA